MVAADNNEAADKATPDRALSPNQAPEGFVQDQMGQYLASDAARQGQPAPQSAHSIESHRPRVMARDPHLTYAEQCQVLANQSASNQTQDFSFNQPLQASTFQPVQETISEQATQENETTANTRSSLFNYEGLQTGTFNRTVLPKTGDWDLAQSSEYRPLQQPIPGYGFFQAPTEMQMPSGASARPPQPVGLPPYRYPPLASVVQPTTTAAANQPLGQIMNSGAHNALTAHKRRRSHENDDARKPAPQPAPASVRMLNPGDSALALSVVDLDIAIRSQDPATDRLEYLRTMLDTVAPVVNNLISDTPAAQTVRLHQPEAPAKLAEDLLEISRFQIAKPQVTPTTATSATPHPYADQIARLDNLLNSLITVRISDIPSGVGKHSVLNRYCIEYMRWLIKTFSDIMQVSQDFSDILHTEFYLELGRYGYDRSWDLFQETRESVAAFLANAKSQRQKGREWHGQGRTEEDSDGEEIGRTEEDDDFSEMDELEEVDLEV